MAKPSQFVYLEYADSLRHTDEIVRADSLPDITGTPQQFISRYLYSDTTGHLTGPLYSSYYGDFDSEDRTRAQAEAKALCMWFVQAGVDEDDLKIRFTGNKGFAIEVPAALFGAEPSEYLNLYWKEVTVQLKKELNLTTLDLSVYDRRRMWRVTNTKHAKSGLFKIPLSFEELTTLNIEEIQDLANEPRLYKFVADTDPSMTGLAPVYALETLFKRVKKAINKKIRGEKKKFDQKLEKIEWDESKIFPCVQKLVENGVNTAQFRREPTAFLVAASLKSLGAPDEYILEQLIAFGERCTPPLSPDRQAREFPNILKQVNKTDYATHCQTECFAANCVGQKECWVFSDEKGPEVAKREEFTEEDRAEAAGVLDGEPLDYVNEALSDVIGESTMKVALFLLQLVEESVRVGGETSTGKSYTTDMVVDCFPKHWVKTITGSSDKALRYMPQFIRTIYFKEFAKGTTGRRGDEESTAEYDMKLLMSEGMLVTQLVEKVEGKLTQTERTVVIHNFLTTSTDVEMAPELRNRQWELSTDRALNMPVVEDALEQIARPKHLRRDCGPQRRILRCALETLDEECPKDYVVPYAKALLDIFVPLGHNARIRRDVRKLLKLIYASARLHYRQRPQLETGEIVCLPEDFVHAWTYGEDAILGTFTEMTKRMQEVWEAVGKMGALNKKLTAGALASVVNITGQKAGDWLRRFTNAGLMEVADRDRSGNVYKLTSHIAAENRVIISGEEMNTIVSKWFKSYGLPTVSLPAIEDVTVSMPTLQKVDIEDLPEAELVYTGGAIGMHEEQLMRLLA